MKWVGSSVAKIDGVAIATGKPLYTDDLVVPGTLIVKLLRSPHAFARIIRIDASVAQKLPGVECVLTYQDVPKIRFTKAGQSFPEPSPYDRLILDSLVRYVGDEVAIVAADDEKTALDALALIQVEYDVLSPVLDISSAIDNPSIVHPEPDLFCNFPIGMEQRRNIASSHSVEIGDIEAELARCEVVVEESYRTQAQAQAMMETFRTFTYLDHAGRLVVVSSTQIPFHIRRQLARALQIPASRIRVIKPRIGGGFGAKQTGVCEVYPALVTLKTGKPAKIVYERKETFIASNSRHATQFKVRMGADCDGFIRAIDIQGLSDTGAYGEHAPTVFAVIGDKTMPLYNKTKAIRYKGHAVYTNKLPGGALRGYGATQGTFVQECTVNKLAEALGMDPVELRLKNLIREGETSLYYKGKMLGSSSLHRCIEKGKQLIGWDEKFPRFEREGKVRSIGMAVTMQGSGIANIDTASAEVRLNDDGSYTVLVGSTDMGTGSDTILLQMAADVLNADMDRFAIHAADTDVSPFDPGSYASSTTYVTGMAVKNAAEKLLKKMQAQGAKTLGVPEEQLEFDGIRIFHPRSDKEIAITKLAAMSVVGSEHQQLSGYATFGSPVSPPPFVAGFAEVEVDRETGKVSLIDYVAVVDCGTVVNPALARVQTEGGIVQGIGMALFEEVQYDSKGNLQTNSFMTYKIPGRGDIGTIRVSFEESFEPTGPFGAKSIGEVVINTPSPAIVAAVYNAVGVRITELPITPEKVFNGMK
jgi:probable selenate reductase molybdenum-binding subunit